MLRDKGFGGIAPMMARSSGESVIIEIVIQKW
jgi:hypothetical protein